MDRALSDGFVFVEQVTLLLHQIHSFVNDYERLPVGPLKHCKKLTITDNSDHGLAPFIKKFTPLKDLTNLESIVIYQSKPNSFNVKLLAEDKIAFGEAKKLKSVVGTGMFLKKITEQRINTSACSLVTQIKKLNNIPIAQEVPLKKE